MKDSTLSFKNQTFFVGIDVHKNKWHITIRSLGMELKTFAMDPIPEQLSLYLYRNYPDGSFRAVYEAGFCGFHIQRKLKKLGVSCIIVNPSDIHTNQKEKLTKTDAHDSKRLAVELEVNRLKSIHIPGIEEQSLRSLCRLRHSLVKDMVRIKNRIKGHLNMHGIRIGENSYSNWSAVYIKKLEKACNFIPGGGYTLRILINNLKTLKTQIKICTDDLRSYLRSSGKIEYVKLLVSVPGIGFLTAATLCCELIDINRFSSFDHLASFAGFIPVMYESAETQKTGCLTPRGHAQLKHMLIEAAWIAIRRDPAMLKKFEELSHRMKKQKAIIRIAKKLLSRIYCVWKNQTPYIMSKV